MVTNYSLYADASKDSMNPKYDSAVGILKELYRWFGPSPMRAPLHLRINNRELMIEQHIRLLGQDPEKRFSRRREGEFRHFMRNLNRKHLI